jgi:hypothetical protein
MTGFMSFTPHKNLADSHKQADGSFYGLFVLSCLMTFFIAACAGPQPLPAPPSPTATPLLPSLVSEITTETLPVLVSLEREASIQGNWPLLAALWAENGRIVDGRGTVEESDNYIWDGRAAILDRYTLAVFPAPPPPLDPATLTSATLTLEGNQATLINQGDRWRFVQDGGRWWLLELVYN